MMQDVVNVAIIIVNYNSGKLLSSNLDKILNSYPQKQLHVFIIDNKSTDDSVALISSAISFGGHQNVSLIFAEHNGGFAYGNNLGFRSALESSFRPDYFYLLNPDAIPQDDAVSSSVSISRTLNDRCIVGSQMYSVFGEKEASAFRFPSFLSELNRGAKIGLLSKLIPSCSLVMSTDLDLVFCDWVCGAGFLIPVNIYAELGGMDEGYFLYYEEVDYMKLAKSKGISILVNTSSHVVHVGGASTGVVANRSVVNKIPKYWYQSWNRFFYKNHSVVYAFLCGFCWVSGRFFNNVFSIFVKRRRQLDGHSIVDFCKFALFGGR